MTCKADGLAWTEVPCVDKEVCVIAAGKSACKPLVCVPKEVSRDSQLAMVCNNTGTENAVEDDCSKPGSDGKAQICVGGQCVASACAPGSTLCADDETAAVCKTDGKGYEQTKCAATTPSCADGQCVKCKPGTFYCGAATAGADSTVIMKCSASGADGDIVTTCAAGKICAKGACVGKQICTPAQTKCDGEGKALVCAPSGTEWLATLCVADTTCKDGACIKSGCTPANYRRPPF